MAGGIGQGSGRPPPLSQAVGYGVIVGLGFFFAFGMMLTTYVLRRYNNELQTSEVFSTAGRTVKTGLVASAVVSSWTWAATLLQSSAVAYRYGVSGPFWYASGATVQIILFATIAIELKRRAPNAHTFLEVIRARYGPITHGVFMVFALMTNILVTAMLLAGGSAVASSLTGMPTAAACFLLPIGVVLYTVFGGIKATFLTDYVHTVVILVILFIFSFATYATNSVLGSPGRVWDALNAASERHPVEGNAQGSYLTMRSREGGIFFVINIIGNFGTVFMDNGYYNKAIAAGISNALPGYVMGGLSWFAIPWLAATAMGLAALSLENNPVWPTYPERMAAADVSAGLVLPEAAVALLGSGGAAAVLLIVFMAVTSAMSAQLIAVSSIATYDIYQTYINPQASGRRLIWTSHLACVIFATVMAAFSTGLYYAGISLGYLYLLMGVIISGAVIPASLTLLWDGQSWAAATFSPPLALACSLTGWLVQASREGPLTVEVTGANNPMLVGNVVALLAPALFVPILSFVFKTEKYDWKSMAAIRKGDDSDLAAAAHLDLELVPGEHVQTSDEAKAEMEKLNKSAKIARIICVVLTLALLILWPMPLYGSGYVFSRPFFTGWIVVGLIWLFISTFCVGLYPLWEGRFTMMRTTRAIYRDITGKGRTLKGEEVVREEVKAHEKADGDKSSTDGEKVT
ncbi:Sodium:solute symporter-like protein 1 [Elsinoe fawcettii]|nr:Sodium:solute symporter-like protein 1 [Elsinoe fawcettii]